MRGTSNSEMKSKILERVIGGQDSGTAELTMIPRFPRTRQPPLFSAVLFGSGKQVYVELRRIEPIYKIFVQILQY